MDKPKFETPDLTTENVAKIEKLFPGAVTEGKINFDTLRAFLGEAVVDDGVYEFTWVGKRKAIREAGRPLRKTLCPVVESEITPTGADSSGELYCSSGSKNWDTTEYLYIEGDNLDVLKLMQESYLGKVKMIYIEIIRSELIQFNETSAFRQKGGAKGKRGVQTYEPIFELTKKAA
jgi:adenine-specific DNA-methyltransferase